MYFGNEFISVGGDDCKRPNPLARAGLLPVLPDAGDTERRTILHGDSVGLLDPLALDGLPLEESVHWKDATSLPIRITKCRQLRDCLGLGIDRFASAGRIVAPIWNQPPSQWVERHLAGLMIASNDKQLLTGRSVPARRVIAHPAVSHIHALHDCISKGPATLNDASAHRSNIISAEDAAIENLAINGLVAEAHAATAWRYMLKLSGCHRCEG